MITGLFIKNQYKMEERKMAKKVVLAGACRTAIGTMGGKKGKRISEKGKEWLNDETDSETEEKRGREHEPGTQGDQGPGPWRETVGDPYI